MNIDTLQARDYSWTAVDANEYCECPECRGINMIGMGATEDEAIIDLLVKLIGEEHED